MWVAPGALLAAVQVANPMLMRARLDRPPPASKLDNWISVEMPFQRNPLHNHRSEAENWALSIAENASWSEARNKWGMFECVRCYSMDRSVVCKSLAHVHKAQPVPCRNSYLG